MFPAEEIRRDLLCLVSLYEPKPLSDQGAKGAVSKSDQGDQAEGDEEEPGEPVSYVAEILKAERQLITGVVLQPEVTDAQGDIMSADVIEKAAFDYLKVFNRSTKLGLQHKSFQKKERRFYLVESYIAPIEFVLNTKTVKKGSWLMTVKVEDPKIWEAVKKGDITGFSIGGRAQAQKLSE